MVHQSSASPERLCPLDRPVLGAAEPPGQLGYKRTVGKRNAGGEAGREESPAAQRGRPSRVELTPFCANVLREGLGS